MSHYKATITWRRNGAAFTDKRYSRGHTWTFDGGVEVPASSSPKVVPLPLSVEQAVDPEEAFIAALASCHMLSFLYVAAKQGFVVDSYQDEATGVLARNPDGKMAVTQVTLHPKLVFAEKRPSADQHDAMHHEAHEECFIASSVKTDVRCEATDVTSPPEHV